jgi:type I restriction enzyme R subunit
VVEAKKAGATLSGVAEQSADYVAALPDFLASLLPSDIAQLLFAYESTGVETFFRDERDPDVRSRASSVSTAPGPLPAGSPTRPRSAPA